MQNDETGLYFIITRTATAQVEETFSLETGEKVLPDNHFLIQWENDCEYILLLDKEKHKSDEWDEYVDSNGGLKNKIIETNESCSIVETTFEDLTIQSEICKTE